MQARAVLNEHRRGQYRHDRLDDLIPRNRLEGPPERELERRELRCFARLGSSCHATTLPAVATRFWLRVACEEAISGIRRIPFGTGTLKPGCDNGTEAL